MTTLKEKVLSRITENFEVMAKVVIKQINLTKTLMEENRDEEIYTEINNNERIIDSLDVKMRDEVINTIVLYSPRATNLRMIMSYYDMTAYLERIGDLLINIAGFLRKIAIHNPLFGQYKENLLNMLTLTENMTQNAIFAFTCEDARLARDTIEMDNLVDACFHKIGSTLPQDCSGQPLDSQQITDALSINSMSYNIERIGDNATNIAEAAIYLMEGKNIKHIGNHNEETLTAGSEG